MLLFVVVDVERPEMGDEGDDVDGRGTTFKVIRKIVDSAPFAMTKHLACGERCHVLGSPHQAEFSTYLSYFKGCDPKVWNNILRNGS